jgi:hypothetical protein
MKRFVVTLLTPYDNVWAIVILRQEYKMKDELAWLNAITLNPSRHFIAHSLFMLRDEIVWSVVPD